MKILFKVTFFFLITLLNAQVDERDAIIIKNTVIFPGCEAYENDNVRLDGCLAKNLTEELSNELFNYVYIMEKNKIKDVRAIIKFTINTKGKIVNVNLVEESYKGFGNYVKSALIRIARRYEINGILIEPAKLGDGTSVDFDFKIPVRFNVQY